MDSLPPNLDPKRPYTIADLVDDENYLIIPQETLQLQVDTLNVLEKRVPIDTFSPERQIEIKHYYRFSATRSNSNHPIIAKRTRDTLDII